MCAATLVALFASLAARAEERGAGADRPFGDLALSTFFSAGWNEPFRRRPRGDGTPDMSLLRVQTNLLASLFRTDFAHQENVGESATRNSETLTGTLEYAFNRRMMLAVIGNSRWLHSRAGEDSEGAATAAFVRLQLIDKATTSLATTLRVGLPSHDLGERASALSLAVAGWQDLGPLGLKRVGLYYSVQEEMLAGPSKPGGRRNSLVYALALAKTWASATSFIGNATTFVEGYARTDLDGDDRGSTIVTLTPGIRATIAHHHVFMAGVEFPVAEPKPFERVIRVTYIHAF